MRQDETILVSVNITGGLSTKAMLWEPLLDSQAWQLGIDGNNLNKQTNNMNNKQFLEAMRASEFFSEDTLRGIEEKVNILKGMRLFLLNVHAGRGRIVTSEFKIPEYDNLLKEHYHCGWSVCLGTEVNKQYKYSDFWRRDLRNDVIKDMIVLYDY